MLTTRFETIMMTDDETFDEFYKSLNDLVNSSFNLDERIPKPKIFKKKFLNPYLRDLSLI